MMDDEMFERYDELRAVVDELQLSKEDARRLVWILANKFKLLLVNIYDRQDIADTLGVELTNAQFEEFVSYCDPASDCESALLEVIQNELNDFLGAKAE